MLIKQQKRIKQDSQDLYTTRRVLMEHLYFVYETIICSIILTLME